MAHSEGLSIVIGGIGVGLIAITTIPSVKALVKNVNQNKRQCYPQIGIIYEDKDGRPTEEAAAAYSDTVQKTLVYSFTVLGFITCTTSAVLSTVEIPSPLLVENWLQFYCFVSLSKPTGSRLDSSRLPLLTSSRYSLSCKLLAFRWNGVASNVSLWVSTAQSHRWHRLLLRVL